MKSSDSEIDALTDICTEYLLMYDTPNANCYRLIHVRSIIVDVAINYYHYLLALYPKMIVDFCHRRQGVCVDHFVIIRKGYQNIHL